MEMTASERAEALDEIRELRAQLIVDRAEAIVWDAAMDARLERLGVPA